MELKKFDGLFVGQQLRSTKQIITQLEIDKVKRPTIEGFDNEELGIIQDIHKEILQKAMDKNDSNEVGILVNLLDWNKIVIYGTEDGISLSRNPVAKNLLLSAPKNSLMFFHNHPRNRWFSERDLDSFMTSDALLMISVVCNNARLFFLKKTADYSKNRALEFYENIFDSIEDSSVREFLRTCSKVGLDFVYGGE